MKPLGRGKDRQACPRNRTSVYAKTEVPWAPRTFRGAKVGKEDVVGVVSGMGWRWRHTGQGHDVHTHTRGCKLSSDVRDSQVYACFIHGQGRALVS